MATKTKIFTESDFGMPLVINGAGKLLAMLDAVLVNGFGQVNVSSIVVAAGVATVTTATAHGLAAQGSTDGVSTGRIYPVVAIAGATPTGLNGEQRVASIPSATTFTFATSVTAGTATGTITSKRAPLGFSIAFTGTNKRVYRSNNVTGKRMYLRIDDTATGGRAKVTSYEAMTTVDAGTRPSPSASQVSGGLEWGYVMYTSDPDTTKKKWTIVGDDRLFYLLMENPNGNTYDNNQFAPMAFGDPITFPGSDTYGSILIGSETKNFTGEDCYNYYQFCGNYTYASGAYWQRDSANTSSAPVHMGATWGFWTQAMQYPNPADGALNLNEVMATEYTSPNLVIRGRFPGLYSICHCNGHLNGDGGPLVNNTPFSTRAAVGPLAELGGWTAFFHWWAGTSNDHDPGYMVAFNGDGDWR